ncbi:MAG: 2-amino-4-hydroxy-6-hydroxymethyldihydropteridine diphosphokinase [Thermoleophilia bacterium]|nr:2-amino-4-hydroxy-6-hydroxymethyldihydropteridine diphosphokinase [Thermoleophilia bacterium]
MADAWLSLGCNVGDCRSNLLAAISRLDAHSDVSVTRVSSVYITEPVGGVEQPSFLNIAAALETGISSQGLHALCREVERELGGRDGRQPMGPRAIDIDILLYERLEITEGELTLPHPRMLERAFVLIPLAEIAGDAMLPDGSTVDQALAICADDHGVEKDSGSPRLDWKTGEGRT